MKKTISEDDNLTGKRLRALRQSKGMSLRKVSENTGVATSYLSNLENGKSSPTLAILGRILLSLDSTLCDFFGGEKDDLGKGSVFKRENMSYAKDANRNYTFLLPKRNDIKAELFDEYLMPGETRAEFEILECDLSGVVLDGLLELEIESEGVECLRPGDAFYINSGKRHRGHCISSNPVRLISIFVPPKY